MITVENGQSDMKTTQELTPEEIFTWTPEDLEEFHQLILTGDTELSNIPDMTDAKPDESTNEKTENTNSLSWEDVYLDEVQQQPAT